MNDLKALLKADSGQPAIALQLVDKKSFETWLKAQPAPAMAETVAETEAVAA